MKTKHTFTLIELMLVTAIVFIAVALAATVVTVNSNKQKQGQVQSTQSFQLGNMVYIEGLNVTGRVSKVWYDSYNLIVKGTSGNVSTLEDVHSSLLKKVPSPDAWKE